MRNVTCSRVRNPFSINRRRFISQTAAGIAAFGVPNLLLKGQDAAGKRLNLAIIGANGKGISDTQAITLEHNVVALVDVDRRRLDEAAMIRERYHGEANAPLAKSPPKLYSDFRRMFDEMSGEIDGVIISTPDHTHFQAAMWALGHKKHICVQKPLCNFISEVRALHEAAREAGVVTQMGNQGRTGEGQRLAKEWIEQGVIGTLQEIRLWTNRPLWPQKPMRKVLMGCPDYLDWDLWLSGEPHEPYFEYSLSDEERAAHIYDSYPPAKSNAVHPHNWRGWWKYGSGALGDMGCHIMDATFSILGQVIPERIEARSAPVSEDCGPEWSRLVYHMPAGRHPALEVTWQDDSRVELTNKPERPPALAEMSEQSWKKARSGMMFIGSDGVIFDGDAYCASPIVYPLAKYAEVKIGLRDGVIKKTEPRSPAPGNPQLEWAHCIVHGGKPSSHFDYSCPLTEFVQLGNLAIRARQTVQWDKEAMRVPNVASANRFISRPAYRDGWKRA